MTLFFAGIADHASGGVEAGRQRRVGDDTSFPDCAREIVFTDDAIPVADQIIEQIKNLRCGRDHISAAMQLAVYLAILAVTFVLMRLYGAPEKATVPVRS